jgi:hypothetical protein
MHLAELAGADPVSVYRSLAAAPDEASMLAEQAARTGTGRGADRSSDGPSGAAAGAPARLVLVVDQFEELFTAVEDADVHAAERTAFVTALHAAATIPAEPHRLPPALVVAAVRADYLEPGHRAARRHTPSGLRRAGGRRDRRGVQPGRQAAGHRRPRRHGAAVADAAFR